jgi:hypothetical protein
MRVRMIRWHSPGLSSIASDINHMKDYFELVLSRLSRDSLLYENVANRSRRNLTLCVITCV